MRSPRLSAVERAELWARCKQGERLSDIARRWVGRRGLCKPRVGKVGGMPERPRQRAARAQNAADREQISWGLAEGLGVLAIARALWRAARPTPCKLGQQPRLRRLVAEKFEARWSPQEIADWLPHPCPPSPL
jgi:hypothetical protein